MDAYVSSLSTKNCIAFQAKVTTKEMASEFLLQILPKRGPDAFRNFMETLVECEMEFVATALDPDMTIAIKNAMQQ